MLHLSSSSQECSGIEILISVKCCPQNINVHRAWLIVDVSNWVDQSKLLAKLLIRPMWRLQLLMTTASAAAHEKKNKYSTALQPFSPSCFHTGCLLTFQFISDRSGVCFVYHVLDCRGQVPGEMISIIHSLLRGGVCRAEFSVAGKSVATLNYEASVCHLYPHTSTHTLTHAQQDDAALGISSWESEWQANELFLLACFPSHVNWTWLAPPASPCRRAEAFNKRNIHRYE